MAGTRRPWKVLTSHELDSYCVDIFVRADNSFGFEHFRRDVEDGGSWTPIGGYCNRRFDSRRDAVAAACDAVAWLDA